MLETNGVHVYLAQAGRDRTHFGVHAIGQVLLHALQTFTHLLTGEINVRGVRKDGGDLREAIAAQRARIFKAGSAGERGFDRERHLLLDQLGRERGCADVNLDLIIGDVRHRVDRQPVEGKRANSGDDDGEQQDKPALLDRPCDDAGDHGLILVARFALADLGLEREASGGGDLFVTGQARTDDHRIARRIAELNRGRSEEHTSELQSLMRISYAVFLLKKKNRKKNHRFPKHNEEIPTIKGRIKANIHNKSKSSFNHIIKTFHHEEDKKYNSNTLRAITTT